jgi:hypothetical protein
MFSMRTNRLCLLLLVTLLTAISLKAQSLDPGKPTPIRSNTILGRIAARDLGDSRLTDHYYALTGTLGDLLITVNTTNLNGDLDVFTASGLRPLLKLSLYAESASPVTKGIYLRKREDLILRIEARTPNDDEGTYQLSFGGSFQPIVGGPDIAENETTPTETSVVTGDGKTKRVSSVGARLPEPERPVTEVATTQPTPEPTPEATPSESPQPSTAEKVEPAPKTTASRPPTRPPTRGRRPAGRRTVTTTPPAPKETETTVTEPKKEETAEVTQPPKSTPSGRGTSRRGAASARAKKPEPAVTPEPEPETGPRLIIETNDGTLINQSMSRVRRVMVENGQVVVVGKDGKIDRIALVNVVRMSIAQ